MIGTRMGDKMEGAVDIRKRKERGVGWEEGKGLNSDFVTGGVRGLHIYIFCKAKACGYICHLR